MVDSQQIFNIIVAVGAFLGVFVFNQIMQRLTRLEDDSRNLRESLPKEYLTKDDYRNDIREVKEILKQIFDRLESKADKERHHPHA